MDLPRTPKPLVPRAVIFDLDGTLADSYQAITESVNFVRAGYNLPPLAEPEVRRHVGRGMLHLLGQLVPGADLNAAAVRYREHHASVLRSGTRLLPGVAQTLPTLKRAGLLLAVCSNKQGRFTRELLGILGLHELMSVVVGPEDAPRLKPAPDMLVAALARLGVPAAEALYVGDMVVDIETARAAGVTVWVVPTGSDDRASLLAARPDRLLESLEELSALVGAK
jgi:phosphoglycolate phosphatase